MTSLTASAPGKLFLTGEYAVLHGAPALVAAVDRRADVHLEPAVDRDAVASVAEGQEFATRARAGDLPGGDAGAVLAALRSARARRACAPWATVTVDSRAFLRGTAKLGLGRSAAALVATTAACLATAGPVDDGDVLASALAANAMFQEGRGSGGDVAAAVRGGVVDVRRQRDRVLVVPRRLPAPLELVVGWTGTPAATVPLLRRFEQALATRPDGLDDLRRAAERAAEAVVGGDAAGLGAAVDESAALLARLGAALGLPIVTPALARLVEIARRLGVPAKPSGAGGGDCGIALAASAAEAAAVRDAWRAAGIEPLGVSIAAEGVRVAARAGEVAHG
jgi:phosphomevalonate kinase